MKDPKAFLTAVSMGNKKKKMAKGGKTEGKHSHSHAYNYDDEVAHKGVNRGLPRYDKKENKIMNGESHMGKSVRQGDMESAKKVAYDTIKEGRNVAGGRDKKPLQGLYDGGMVHSDENSEDEISRNSGDKAPKQDSMTSRPDKVSLKGRTYAIKRPKMVPSDAFSTRLRDEEADLQESAKINNGPQVQPPEHDNEEEADKSGPDATSLHMKRMYEGGAVSQKDAEDDNAVHPEGLEEDDDMEGPSKEEFMSGSATHPASRMDAGFGKVIMKAKGGKVDNETSATQQQSRIDMGWGKVIAKADGGEISPEDEMLDHHAGSLTDAIMAKRKRMADGGQVDIDSNAEESPNAYYGHNEDALKENYDSDMDDVSQPEDSNEHGHELSDEDAHDMVAIIRHKMKSRKK